MKNTVSTGSRLRIGRFVVDEHVLRDVIDGKDEAKAAWYALFGKCIVIETRRKWESFGVEYLCHCEDFPEVHEGIEAPHYIVQIRRDVSYAGGAEVVTFTASFIPKETS